MKAIRAYAWSANMLSGTVIGSPNHKLYYLWPVRNGRSPGLSGKGAGHFNVYRLFCMPWHRLHQTPIPFSAMAAPMTANHDRIQLAQRATD